MTAPRQYRLRGDVAGSVHGYPLRGGLNRLGSLADNEVVLPVRGVSRHHACLTLSEQELLVEDLRSRNGTLVNGVRVQRSQLRPGDELRLGPVALRLELLEPGDAKLGIALDAAGPAEPGLPPGRTTMVSSLPGGAPEAAWLRLLEDVLERLCARSGPDLPGALAVLVRESAARGACLLEWIGDDPVVVAAHGELGDLAARGSLREIVKRAGAEPDGLASASLAGAGGAGLVCAVAAARGQAPRALALWGGGGETAENERVLRTLLRLLERFRPSDASGAPAPAGPRELAFPDGYVRGASPAMAALYVQMQPLLHGDLPVLIVGETGAGKEHVARILHASSSRRKGPFLAVNCAAIPAELLEAEMFGIGKGVATGVVERVGKFQLAQGGTLFLDEIGDMSPGLQAKLLRALQEKEVQPVGAPPVPVDIRVLTATNTDLLARVEQERFRRDLYYRVAGFVLRVPPLRERREDVPALVERFVRDISREAGRRVRGVSVKALQALCDYRWPGNVRELEHEVRRLVYLCPDGEAIDWAMLSPQLQAPVLGPDASAGDAGTGLDLDARVRELEARLIREALARAGGNRTQAAKLLGVSRNGLAIKIERLGIGGPEAG